MPADSPTAVLRARAELPPAANDVMRALSQRLREVEAIARLGSWRTELATGAMEWSDELYRMCDLQPGGPVPDLAGHAQLYAPESWARLMAGLQDLLAHDRVVEEVVTLLAPSGERYVRIRARCHRDASGQPFELVGTTQDVTEEVLRQQHVALQAAAMNSASNVMYICDADGRIEWINPAFTAVTGFSGDEALGQTPRILKSGQHEPALYAVMWAQVLRGETWRGRLTNRRRNGEFYEADQTITPMRDDGGRVTHFVAVQEDVTERVRAERKMLQLAMFDGITGLPNRNMFQHRAGDAVAAARGRGRGFALMLLDLDHFKSVNDSLGHAAGDQLLLQVSRRLGATLRPGDFIARLGGDEFAVLVEDVVMAQDAAVAAQRLLEVFREPFKVGGSDFVVRGSLGIALWRSGVEAVDTLIKEADLAMYAAKGRARGGYQFFDSTMDALARRRFSMEAALHEALRNDSLALVFQPQFDLASGDLVGAEALLRWHDAERGAVPPNEFVALAEQSGMIFELNDWVLRNAMALAAQWKRRFARVPTLAVNLSASHFDRSGLAAQLAALLRSHALEPADIELEITESVMMRRSSTVADNLRALSSLGIAIAVDDFGTGYSSLLSLRDFPVKRLKIDASFVRGIGANPKDEQIVRTIVSLGGSLAMRVLAEGVETPAQHAFLRDAGCSEVQGYLTGRPMTAAAFEQLLEQAA